MREREGAPPGGSGGSVGVPDGPTYPLPQHTKSFSGDPTTDLTLDGPGPVVRYKWPDGAWRGDHPPCRVCGCSLTVWTAWTTDNVDRLCRECFRAWKASP